MKRLLVIAGIVIGVIIVVLLAIPLFINVDSFRPDIEKKLSDSLGRQVQIGKISASLFSGGAEADNISIGDDPAFSQSPFLQASSLKIGLQIMPLIFSRQLKVTSLAIKDPDIHLVENKAGKWNYSSLGNSSGGAKTETASSNNSSSSSSGSSDLSVDKLEIQNGKLEMKSGGKEQTYTNVNLTANNISTTSAIPFIFSAVIPGGSLNLQGQAGPLNQQDSSKTALDAKLMLQHADLAAIGLAGNGVGGLVDFDGSVKSDGHHLVSTGKATANKLLLVKGGSPTKEAVALDYNSDFDLESQTGSVHLDVHTGNSITTANGTLNAHGESMTAQVKVTGKNMAVNDVVGLLPALNVTLPSGASLQGGDINLNLDAQGPLDSLVINGPVSVTGTHLVGYDLTGKLGAVAALAGIKSSNDTLIQTFSSTVRVAPEGIRADSILLDVPSIGQLTGNGTVSNSQQLDFKMVLKLSKSAGMLGQLTNVGGAKNNGIPFTITGTSSNPTFRPSGMGGLFSQSQSGQQQGVGGVLNNLLGKKKKSP